MPWVTIFFLSESEKGMRIPFPMIMVTMNTIIINPMEAHLLSSPSIESKTKVAATPATTAKPTLSQNSLFSLLSFSLCCSGLIESSGAPLDGSSAGGVFVSSFSGSPVGSIPSFGASFPGSSLPFVGSDFFFLNLANEISIVTVPSLV